jgi:hypothetical protein
MPSIQGLNSDESAKEAEPQQTREEGHSRPLLHSSAGRGTVQVGRLLEELAVLQKCISCIVTQHAIHNHRIKSISAANTL